MVSDSIEDISVFLEDSFEEYFDEFITHLETIEESLRLIALRLM